MAITDECGDALVSVDADIVADPSGYDTFVAVVGRTYSHDPATVVNPQPLTH